MDDITAYAAGAGTGKTYTICEEIAAAIREGLDPARIVATTFTNRAAAELKGRVLARLWEEDALTPTKRTELAERLELAAIGTVHGVGYQLLRRYALRIGLSPRLNVLDEDAAKRHLDHLLADTPLESWERLVDLGRPLEFSKPQTVARRLLDVKRTNRISDDDFRDQLNASTARLLEILAPAGPDSDAGDPSELPDLAADALDRMAQLDDDTKTTAGAMKKLRELRELDDPTWKDVVQAGRISAGKRSGADDCLQDLRAFAADVRRMPKLHDDIRDFMDALVEQTLALGDRYDDYKVQRGLLDYTDLEAFLLRALERDDVQEDLAASFDVVFVDEFQDSNPIQLAIFLKLHEPIGRSYWVGDDKQSIYAFRDADLDLVRSAWELVDEDNMRPLDTSYRSQAGLVQVVSRLFEPIFGDGTVLKADRDAEPRGLERWVLAAKNYGDEHAALAEGILELRAEGVPFGDVAVLARTNRHARSIGDALADQRIPSIVSRPGLLGTRECRVAVSALRVVADSYDGVAAAEVLHLLGDAREETPAWLVNRLEAMGAARTGEGRTRAGPPWADAKALQDLDAIDRKTLPPSAILARIVQRLDLPAHLARWGDVERRRANLDALLGMAADYEDEMEEEGRGASVRGLITWLETQADDEEDTFPMPEGLDAVTVSTYHGSKGLEWPVAVLSDLDHVKDADVWEARVEGGDVAEGQPLDGRRVGYWPWPFGEDHWRRRVTGSGLNETALATDEGQAHQQAHDAERDRLLYVGMTRARDRLVVTHRGDHDDGVDPDKYAWLARIPIDDVLDPGLAPGEHDMDGVDTTGVVRHLAPPEDDMEETDDEDLGTALAVAEPGVPAVERKARYRQPSGEPEPDEKVEVHAEPLPGPDLELPRIETGDWRAVGDAVHAYLAALPSLRGVNRDVNVQVANRCLRIHRCEGVLSADALVMSGECVKAWVEQTYPNATWRTELPVTAPSDDGRQWDGIIDLLLELEDRLVVVDFKVRPIPESMWEAEARKYTGQIEGYRKALEATGEDVCSGWILFVLAGGACRIGGDG